MPQSDFTVSIKQDSVEVRLAPSVRSPHAKLGGAIFSASTIIAVLCALLFFPGKQNRPSMWHDMCNASIGSEDFLVPLTILILGCLFMGWIGSRWSAAAWPSDETLHCDRTGLTISRIPWLDFSNRLWKTKSYAVADIQSFRFAVYASAKGSSIYGFRFRANGTRHKTLPGLEAPEAQNILKALQHFGVDVILDDNLQKKADETSKNRDNAIAPSI